jgi:hypothetical protein
MSVFDSRRTWYFAGSCSSRLERSVPCGGRCAIWSAEFRLSCVPFKRGTSVCRAIQIVRFRGILVRACVENVCKGQLSKLLVAELVGMGVLVPVDCGARDFG